MPVLRSCKRAVFRACASASTTTAGAKAAALVSTLDRAFQNDSDNLASNGERRLLQLLADTQPTTVLDVGANRGDWTAQVLEIMPKAKVHAFEPVAECWEAVHARFSDDPRVTVQQLALTSSGRESLEMFSSGHSTLASAVARPDVDAPGFMVEALSGDEYLKRAALGTVDLLKIDVEGHDLAVLQGFSGALQRQAIGVVQFEFTAWAAIARVWLADFYALLDSCGYAVGKVYPRGVVWRTYRPQDEIFYRCNFVAVGRGSDVQRLLAAR